MKIYLKVICIVLFTIINIGIILPFLISANSNELFALGVLDIIVMFPVYFYSIKSVFKGESNA